jgi:UDP-N-acetylmuramoyl-L-alanyl-D-glutamate--2,6-diaminopimelate ligase
MELVKSLIQKIIPSSLYEKLLRPYHFVINFLAAYYYGEPAKKLIVIGVTGTKGKSTVSDMIGSILRAANVPYALSNTVHFVIRDSVKPNLFKMTVPGRGFLQKFLRDAVNAGCTHAVLELSSESTLNFRHLGVMPNMLVVTNLQPEHLERHGGMENYFKAKYELVRLLERSPKRPRHLFVGTDDEYGARFLKGDVEHKKGYSLSDASHVSYEKDSVTFTYGGTVHTVGLPGDVSVKNAIAAIEVATALSISASAISEGLLKLHIPGRFERIDVGQPFTAIVDYAHTPDSLQALYDAFPHARKICVLGNTGGGRDGWKRPLMGKIASEMCDEVILTNEDPYDEDPRAIIDSMTTEMKKPPTIIMDRREAIASALALARSGDAVLISGKGSDPYIMEAHGKKTPWSDAQVVAEELRKIVV